MFDHDDGVAEVAQPLERLDETPVVTLVQTYRRLIEDVEHPDEAAPDLAGKTNPLCLTTGQGRCRAIK